jgi:FkbM family methyltransferase
LAAVARRIERPELLATVYPGARQELYEQIGIRTVLASALRRDATYVDVGANRGQILREAIRVAPRGRHIIFEPIPSLAADLAREFSTAECRQMALGARRETTQFCHFRSLDGWSGLRRSRQISDERGDPEFIEVDVSTLDVEIGGLVPRVVKIDVEGAELEVIEGGRTLLLEARPILILEHVASAAELYGRSSAELWELLAELNYELFSVSGDGPFTRAAFCENRRVVNWLGTPIDEQRVDM